MTPKINFTKKHVTVDSHFSFDEMSVLERALNESVTLAAADDFQKIKDLTSVANKLGLDVSAPISDSVDSELSDACQEGNEELTEET